MKSAVILVQVDEVFEIIGVVAKIDENSIIHLKQPRILFKTNRGYNTREIPFFDDKDELVIKNYKYYFTLTSADVLKLYTKNFEKDKKDE